MYIISATRFNLTIMTLAFILSFSGYTLAQEPIKPIEPIKVINLAKAELGKKLYFDPRLSKSGFISCNSCHNLSMGVITLATYPMSVFKGFAKFLILTVVPAGFISGVPVELLHEFKLSWFLMTIGFTIFVAFLAVVIFYHGLKRYESGNLLYVRT